MSSDASQRVRALAPSQHHGSPSPGDAASTPGHESTYSCYVSATSTLTSINSTDESTKMEKHEADGGKGSLAPHGLLGEPSRVTIGDRDSSEASHSGSCTRLCRAMSLVPPGATTPRWSIIFHTVFALFVCVVNITMLFPYLPQMIRDMGFEEELIGYYAGIVASSYFIGAFFSSVLWGFLTDYLGRRCVVLLCLSGTGVFTIAFGFSTSIHWAFASRGLVGAFNGIIGASKAILGDISDNTNQAVGLALLAIGWGSGLLLGPSIGGYLSEPHKKYPSVFKDDGTFAKYPYFFPNLISAALCLIALSICSANLPETRTFRLRRTSQEQAEENTAAPEPPSDCDNGDDQSPLLPRATTVTPTTHSLRLRLCCRLFSTSNVIIATSLFSVFSFACVALDETIALWAATKRPFGGLGFSTTQLGTMTGALNVPCLLMNIVVFPRLERLLGSVRTFCLGACLLCVTTAAIPFINRLLSNSLYLWLALVIVLVPNRMMYPLCWSAADILINNSVYAEYLGLVNGVSMTFSFVARSASPIAAGTIFSWSITEGSPRLGFPFGHHFVFFVIDATMIACLFIGLFTPRGLDKQLESYEAIEEAAPKVEVVAPTPDRDVGAEDREEEEVLRRERIFSSTLSSSLNYRQIRNFRFPSRLSRKRRSKSVGAPSINA